MNRIGNIKKRLYPIKLWCMIKCYQSNIPFLQKRLAKKKKVKVVFLALSISFWKYDRVFRLMCMSSRFTPLVVTIPIVGNRREKQIQDMREMYTYFSERGFTVVEGYDFETNEYIDASGLMPDLVFYCQPYNWIIPESFRFYNLKTTLFAYVPYAFWLTAMEWGYNEVAHNICWKLFYSTSYQKQDARRMADIKDKNVCVTGYPMADEFLSRSNRMDPWKIADRRIKRVIWAPHFSLHEEGLSNQSNFLLLSDSMLRLAQQYKETIQIAFKPHPILLNCLYDQAGWGKQRADAYYETWRNLENGTLVTGDYVDLFLTSDAIIHDSSSFIAEYLFTGNPTLFITKATSKMQKGLSEFGKKAFDLLYKGTSEADIVHFINEVVLGENDPIKPCRDDFFQKYLLPPNGKSAAENIVDEIIKYVKTNG